MKKLWWLVPCLIMVLALGLVGCTPGGGPQTINVSTQQNTGIWVAGQGEVMAVPDIAILNLGVEARGDTVAEAQAEAAVSMDKVIQTLKDSGVKEKDIQTQRYSIYPITRWVKDEEEKIIGYRVTNTIVAKIRELDKASNIIDDVTEAGGDYTRIQGISFTIDDPVPFYEEARAEAVKDAENKAKQFASLTGVKLGKPTYISEGAVYVPSLMKGGYYDEMGAAPPPTPISPGELKITINVQIAYAIV